MKDSNFEIYLLNWMPDLTPYTSVGSGTCFMILSCEQELASCCYNMLLFYTLK